ncbi:cyclic nucleotide-binding domain-containing protein [Glacieibacterium frigidum]|uniref:Cyclic nucleotide-binding domain-containing protein n=1 Tax=Glacieibacterium frigidum TaxID=2593303 RepID=A0A552UAA8_9SPHN|nr:cyclic nucleotide-binding domain-containing protein [Glacieibacterium frigidum]TRW15152.1 cyclic nucleotide-binding domain-containing protein [Glacieibacterium frigidum]
MASLESFRAPTRPLTDQLRRVPLFAALPTDRRGCLELLREGALFEVPAGVEIVAPGDAAALLVVTEGALADDGGTRVWSAGSYLGVAEALGGLPFTDAVRTVAPTLLYRLDGALVAELMTRCPAIAASLRADFAPAARRADFTPTASI